MQNQNTTARKTAAENARQIACCAAYDAAAAARRGDADAARRCAGIAAAAADSAPLGMANSQHAATFAADAAAHAGRNEHTRQQARGIVEDAARLIRGQEQDAQDAHAARPDADWIDRTTAINTALRNAGMGDAPRAGAPTPRPAADRTTKEDGNDDAAAMRELIALFEIAHSAAAPTGAHAAWVSSCERHDAAIERHAEQGALWADGRYGIAAKFARKANDRRPISWIA